MGIIKKTYYERIIDEVADRNANLVKVYEKDNGEVVIHFRNLKIVLLTNEEIKEWKTGFTQALKEYEISCN